MSKQNLLIGTAVFTILVLLAGGTYTAVRLLTPDGNGGEETAVGLGSGRVIESIASVDGGAPVAVRTTILPAPELPSEQAAAAGVLISREDNNLLIGTGAIDLDVDIEVDPATGQETVSLIPTTDGPELEVVLTPDTILYRDVTDMSLQPGQESGEREVVQQVRQVNSAEEISGNMELEVWGERRGDRIVAAVLVYGPLGGGAFE